VCVWVLSCEPVYTVRKMYKNTNEIVITAAREGPLLRLLLLPPHCRRHILNLLYYDGPMCCACVCVCVCVFTCVRSARQ
jgi:hypothetical protein